MKRILFFAIVAFFSILLSAQDTITREKYNRMVDYTICVAAHKHFETRIILVRDAKNRELIQGALAHLNSCINTKTALSKSDFETKIKRSEYGKAYGDLIDLLQRNYDKYVDGMSLEYAIDKATSYNKKPEVGNEVMNSINIIRDSLKIAYAAQIASSDAVKSNANSDVGGDINSPRRLVDLNEDNGMDKTYPIAPWIIVLCFVLICFLIVYIFIKLIKLERKLDSKDTSSDDNSRGINRLDYLKSSDFSNLFDVYFKKKNVITKEEVQLLVKNLMLDNQKTTPSTEVAEKNGPVIQTSVSDSMSATYYAEPMDESNYFQRVTSEYDPYCHVYKILVSPSGKAEFTLCDNKDMYPSFIANKSEKLTSCEFSGRSLDAKGIELGKNGEVEKEPSGKWKMTKKMIIKFK